MSLTPLPAAQSMHCVLEAEWPWYAVRVRSKFEQVASSCLAAKGYEQFVPTYRARRRWSDRIKETEVPIFPGYVFCRFNALDRMPVITSPGVVDIVCFGRELAVVEEHEIAAVRAILGSRLAAQPWPFLQSGDRVALSDGPLRGVEGIVIEAKGACRLVVSITLLQRSMAVEVQRDWVRPIN